MEHGDQRSPTPEAVTTGGRVAWPAVAIGAAVGLAVIVAVALLRAIADRQVDDLDDTGWPLALFVLLLAGYLVAGWTAQRRAEHAGCAGTPLLHGALAGLGAFVAWIPLRVVIWLARDEDGGLVGGSDAALRPAEVLVALLIAAGVAAIGALIAARRPSRGVA